MSAFADGVSTEAVLGPAIDEDDYDDSAIIVVEEEDGEWKVELGQPFECTGAREEVESQSEDGLSFGTSVRLIGCGSPLVKNDVERQPLASLVGPFAFDPCCRSARSLQRNGDAGH